MRALSFDHVIAADLLGDQLDRFAAAAEGISDYELLGGSRVHAWSRLDVVVHVRAGLEEMAAVCAAQVEASPDHDAASYWASFVDRDDDPVPGILWMRRTAAAYTRPSGALRHLADVVGTARLALRHVPDRPVLFQGKAMTSGDFLATWVVELAVHQLDLGEEAGSPTAGSLAVVRRTVEALADVDLPAAWDDETVALAGFGRQPLPADAGDLTSMLPLSI